MSGLDVSQSSLADKDIKSKLNQHLKKRINGPGKRKGPIDKDTDESVLKNGGIINEGPSKKSNGKGKAKKAKVVNAEMEEDSDREEGGSGSAAAPQTVSTLDVLQVLLNQKKRSLLRSSEVIDFIRAKQGRIQ